MVANGSENIAFTQVIDGTHNSVVAQFAMETFSFFEGLK